MPSPIAHVAAGYAIYHWFGAGIPSPLKGRPALFVLAACACSSLIPDLDSVVGVLAGNLGRFHNNLSHSIVAGVLAALVGGATMKYAGRTRFTSWFLLLLACYEIHVFMDYLTAGRGIMAFWPFIDTRFQSPWLPFRGVQWAMGAWTIEHVWTVLNELVFVAVLGLAMLLMRAWRAARFSEAGASRFSRQSRSGQLP